MKNFWLAFLSFAVIFPTAVSADVNRWTMRPDGSNVWRIDGNLPHEDFMELSGKQVSVVVRYGVDAEGMMTLTKSMVWPMLRTIPNNTHGNLMLTFRKNDEADILIGEQSFREAHTDSVALKGSVRIWSRMEKEHIAIKREIFPSTDKPAVMELITLTNTGNENCTVRITNKRAARQTDPQKGVKGSYTMVVKNDGEDAFVLKSGESKVITVSIQAYGEQKGERELSFNGATELRQREALVDELQQNLVLESPDAVINRMFAFSKVRASESIYQTASGPMHGPGGERYYAAIWANDQAEYVSPFFPYEGYDYGNQSAMVCYKLFARYMNDSYTPLPCSIIAEGLDIWNGAGDRGDAAMVAYGAGRYLLARASKEEAQQLWPLIKWCLEYCHRKLNKEGVVTSDCDELEGRFPAGKANLCTSTLYYDGLLSASYLCKEMGESGALAKTFTAQAAELRKNIESYFGTDMEGFHTYRYYEGNDVLRSWICMPLVVGIMDRKEGTIDALFSPKMWTDNGLLTQEGNQIFWDRSTLYALRGVYTANEPDKATNFLHSYSNRRLLGEHVPYAIEAWPEGSQSQLSAESGLYARIITEGLVGIRPTGFHSFSLKPEPPSTWNQMALRHIRAFGTDFDILVNRTKNNQLKVTVSHNGKAKVYKLKEGNTISVNL